MAILAEGYTPEEMPVFYKDAAIACESLFAHEPFRSMKKHFNIVAVASPSEDSGVSVPPIWAVFLVVANFALSIKVAAKTIPDIKDDENS